MPTCCFLNPISVYLWMQSLHRDFSCTLRIQTKAKELWIRFVIFTKFQTHNALKSLFPTHLFRTTAFKKTFTWNCLAFYQLLLHLFAKQCKNEINFVLLNFSISLVRPWQRFAGKWTSTFGRVWRNLTIIGKCASTHFFKLRWERQGHVTASNQQAESSHEKKVGDRWCARLEKLSKTSLNLFGMFLLIEIKFWTGFASV